MKKPFLSLALSAVMLFGAATVSAQDWVEPTPLNVFDNDLFTITGEIRDVETNDGTHGEIINEYLSETMDTESPLNEFGTHTLKDIHKTITFEDGARYKEFVTKIDATEYLLSLKEAYTDYFDGDLDNNYLVYSTERSETGYFTDLYLLEKTGDEFVRTPFLSEERIENKETYSFDFNLYTFTDEDGVITRTKINDEIIPNDEFENLKYELGYNDGLKYETYKGYSDINDKIYLEDYGISYYFSSYNLGYMLQSSNNGGTLDWEQENPERFRVYSTDITNIITNEQYFFGDVYMDIFRDNGYTEVSVKGDDGERKKYVAKLKNPAIITVFLNGRKIKFDQIPVVDNGRTLVPLRAIFEKLGAEISWNEETKTVTATKDETKIELTIDSTTATKNGEAVALDVPAKVVNGRTLVPVRFVADCFGVNVDWIEDMKQVKLTTSK